MKLEIFQSQKGDCLLLEGKDGGRVLCDGGMAKSMRDHVRGRLAQLHVDGEQIDAIYVSHIDQDHISGVLQLLQDLLRWKIFEHHRDRGDTEVREPRFPRPPEIGGIWHNAFRDLITRNRGRIEELIAATAPVMLGSGVPEAMHYGAELSNIATSIPEALKVSRLIKPDLLGIPLNEPPGRPDPGQLLLIEEPNAPFPIGSLNFRLIGPSKSDLRKLRKGWDNWLRDPANRARTRRIRREMRRRVEDFSNGTLEGTPFDLRDWNGVPDFDHVSVPNTASLMFLVEEEGRSLLLTGDSHQETILEGLETTGQLDDGFLHVDALKVQHHGSEHNVDRNFCRRISADHYVFCGNGSHGNPEREVLKMFFDARLGSPNHRALAPEAEGREFTFWFSTTADRQNAGSAARRSFEETERVVADLVARSDGQMHSQFNAGDSITLTLE